MRPDHYDQLAPAGFAATDHYYNIKRMLDRWAEVMSVGGNITEGAPNQSIGAPDARVHSIEDLEIESDKHVVRAVNACVYEIPVMERNAVLMYYGLMKCQVWRANFDVLFDMAIESLFKQLKHKVVC
jgi:hypothetical protein